MKLERGTYTLEIPQDGVLRIKSFTPFDAWHAPEETFQILERSQWLHALFESIDFWLSRAEFVSHEVVPDDDKRLEGPTRDVGFPLKARNVKAQVAVTFAAGDFKGQFVGMTAVFRLDAGEDVERQIGLGD